MELLISVGCLKIIAKNYLKSTSDRTFYYSMGLALLSSDGKVPQNARADP